MKKRDLFSELEEDFDALEYEHTGAIGLSCFTVEHFSAPKMTAAEFVRAKLKVSQAVLARSLGTEARTIANWGQGRSKPNAQAAILLRVVDLHPELLDEIATL